MIFTDQIVHLESSSFVARFFANSLNNEEDITTYLHCLFLYEPVNPSIIDSSKERVVPDGFFDFIESDKDMDEHYLHLSYVPVVICIKSKNNFVDFFRKILKCLYLHLLDISSDNHYLSGAIKSLEFIKYASILINDCIVPPYDMNFVLKIGKHHLQFPFESRDKIVYNESAVAILMDLVDIRNIIDIWENLMTNKHVFLMSCDEYLLFLIIQAFKSLLFPMKWEDKVIPVLAPHLIDILDCPFPVLIGINTSKIPKEQALERLEEKIILDIDTNIIYFEPSKESLQESREEIFDQKKNGYDEMLCECIKSSISKKLQLLKTYYYVDKKRISIYRRVQMEKALEDEEFVKSARKILETDDKEEKESRFVSLVKKTFFKVILDGLSEFELYMEKKLEIYVFNKEKFKNSQGFCKKCRSSKFWQGVIENSNFQQLVKYYKKYDESYVARFIKIIQKTRSADIETSHFYNFTICPEISAKTILDILKNNLSCSSSETPEKEFKKKSAEILLNDLYETIKDSHEFYEQAEFKNLIANRRHSFTVNYRETLDIKYVQSCFYGKFGIIRCLSSIFAVQAPELFAKLGFIFSKFPTELNLQSPSPNKYEPVIVKLFYSLKSDENMQNYQEIINQMTFINQKCPELLPEHLVFYCLNKIFERDSRTIELLTAAGGKLGNIARDVAKMQLYQRQSSGDVYSQDDLTMTSRIFRTLSEHYPN